MTVKEIARLAGVSPSTVSIVLNGKAGVGSEKRERITALLLENGFTIRDADGAGSQPKGTVKFIRYRATGNFVERNDDFITQVMEGVDAALRRCKYTMSVVNVDDSDFETVLGGLRYEKIVGVIFLGTEFDAERYGVLADLEFPVVAVDNCFRNYPINSVDMANIEGARLALRHLYEHGHRRIGYLKGSIRTGSLKERCAGVYQAMHTLGLKMREEDVVRIEPVVNGACEDVCRYLAGRPSLPTAFFADNDVMATGALRAFQRCGLRVPADVSLVGFDDSLIGSVIEPALTTIHIFKREMGEIAAKRLIDMMETGDRCIAKTSIGVTLVERDTVAAPRKAEIVW